MTFHLRKIFWKTLLLSTVLGIFISVWNHYYVNGFSKNSNNTSINTNENIEKFKKVNNSDMASISVAITTNIWTNHTLINSFPSTDIYNNILSIDQAMFDIKNTNDEIIAKNMIATQEYENVLKIDIKNLIENSLNKQEILNAYISQLEFRFTTAITHSQNLISQKEIFTKSLLASDQRVEDIKAKIEIDFNSNDADASLINIDNYLDAKNEYNFARTYIIYINQFLTEYQQLNEYNKNLLDVLINNKEAIIKDAFLIIPNNWGINSLKELDLLFEEADFKNQ